MALLRQSIELRFWEKQLLFMCYFYFNRCEEKKINKIIKVTDQNVVFFEDI